MADPRRRTMLDFAIAASVAVVPVLLGVLLVVGVVRPADPATVARIGDRHVSVRQVAALKTFERAIVRRPNVAVGPPSAILILDRLPQCRSSWDGHGSALDRLRGALASAGAAPPSPAQRLAAQLGDLDLALLRFSTGANRRVSEAVGFDSARWFDAVTRVLETPIEASDYPGRRFTVQCADIAHAALLLARSNGRMLGALSWRGTEVARVVSRWRPDQFVEISARQLARANPWLGLPGCVYMGSAAPEADRAVPAYFVTGGRPREGALCARPEVFAASEVETRGAAPVGIAGEATADLGVDDPRWKVPPSLEVMLQPLSTLRRPSGSLYRLYTETPADQGGAPTGYRYGANRIDLGGAPIDLGFSVDLTIDPSLQALAQKISACYTGRQDVCRAIGVLRQEDAAHPIGHRMLEHAMVRMAAHAVIDVASGRIEALAGALSPCTRQEYDGPGRDPKCDKRLPYPSDTGPMRFSILPSSTTRCRRRSSSRSWPTAFLSDPDVGARWLAAERAGDARAGHPGARQPARRTDALGSARFLDRMFCADQGFVRCERPWRIQAMALGFGWNGGCVTPREDCGKRDLLFGRAIDDDVDAGRVTPLATVVPYGRLLTEPVGGRIEAPFDLRPEIALDSARVRTCASAKHGRSAAAAWSSTSSPKAGARATREQARSASPA